MSKQEQEKVDLTNDMDNDGQVTEADYDIKFKMQKAISQGNIARAALAAFVLPMFFMLIPGIVPDERIKILANIFDMYFLSLASIIGAYMGFSTWLARK